MDLEKLMTEGRNPRTLDIDKADALQIATLINEEDKRISDAVSKVLPQVAVTIEKVVESFRQGGRLFYIGAGTSGRLGILDAAECPPTFGTDPELVQGLIAGGVEAVFRAVEGAEDSPDLGERDLRAHNLTARDVVVGIAASGRTPYVIGGLSFARTLGCFTTGVSCTPESALSHIVDVEIATLVGPEVIMGSTRLKAGTAQKMILNMITTGAMIRWGKVYSNLMVDMQETNEKLEKRAKRIVSLATGVSLSESEEALHLSKGVVKLAIVMLMCEASLDQALEYLSQGEGRVSEAIRIGLSL